MNPEVANVSHLQWPIAVNRGISGKESKSSEEAIRRRSEEESKGREDEIRGQEEET